MATSWVHAQVLAGTVNVGSGLLQVETNALAADSAVARVAGLVEQVIAACFCTTQQLLCT